MSRGVLVRNQAFTALSNCCVKSTGDPCTIIEEGGTARLHACTLLDSGVGVSVQGAQSRAHASHCSFHGNSSGARAMAGARLIADACTSSRRKYAGYEAKNPRTLVELTSCTSTSDMIGCRVEAGAKLTATKVSATKSEFGGFCAQIAGKLVLRDCVAANCGEHGVHADGEGTKVNADGCTLQTNGLMGVCAIHSAVVDGKGCRSSGHMAAAYMADKNGVMTVSSSFSEGDSVGCAVEWEGDARTVDMDRVTVDGTLTSSKLP